MKQLIPITLLALLMGSCGIYNKYERPEVPLEGLFRDTVAPTDTASLGNLPWRELFADPSLQALIEEGLASNADLAIARLRVVAAEATLLSARLSYLPSLSLAPQGSLSSFDGQKAAKTYQLSASASWEVDIFGRLTNANRRAKALLEQSTAYRQAVQTQLVANIANSYYTLLMLDQQLSVSQQTCQTWRENLKAMQALKAAGQYNEAAVAQAEAGSLAAESSVVTLKQQINETENSLSTLLGAVPRSVVRGSLEGQTFPESLSAGVPLQLLGNRPDVRQAEASLAAAFYSTNQARSAFYPSITLGGTAGWTNSGGAAIANPGALLLSAVASLTQPLFNKGQNVANLQIAKAQQAEATFAFRQALLDAGAEVNNALTQFQSSRQRSTLAVQQVAALERAVRSTRLLMQHGTTTYLEVLTAQQTLLQAQLTQVSDRFDEIQSLINLYRALGGGVG